MVRAKASMRGTRGGVAYKEVGSKEDLAYREGRAEAVAYRERGCSPQVEGMAYRKEGWDMACREGDLAYRRGVSGKVGLTKCLCGILWESSSLTP